MRIKLSVLSLFFATMATGAWAVMPEPVSLGEIRHADASLTVVGADGTEKSYSPGELERFSTYTVKTTTPWRDEPAEFTGVMLSDLLDAHGLADAEEIRVTAENDFTSTIPRAVWKEVPIMVVTRVDGKAHSRRARGPIQFVIDSESYEASDVAQESHLVWMAARIEVPN